MLAPANAGMDNKNEILLESNLLNLKILAVVIVIPALLTPGISASIWNKPIIKIFFKFKLVVIFLSNLLLSAKYKAIPKIKVVHAIILISLSICIISVTYIMYPKMIKGTEPNIIKPKSFWLFLMSSKSFLKKTIIANKDPRWRLISIKRELD